MKFSQDLIQSKSEVRFLKGDQTPVCADAVLTIPNPSFFARTSNESTCVSSEVSNSEPIVSSAVSNIPVYTKANINNRTSEATTAPVMLSKKAQNIQNSNNKMVIGNVYKTSVVSDPTALPVLMPVATDKAFPASPDDVVLPAGKGYVVFKPMGNLPKDCVYTIESSTGLINAVVDPHKFVKPSGPAPKIVSSHSSKVSFQSNPIMSVKQNQSVQPVKPVVEVPTNPIINPKIQAILKKHFAVTDKQGDCHIKEEDVSKESTVSTMSDGTVYTSFLSQVAKNPTLVTKPSIFKNKTSVSQDTSNSGCTEPTSTLVLSGSNPKSNEVPVKVIGYPAPPGTSGSSFTLTKPVVTLSSVKSSPAAISYINIASPNPTLKKVFTDPKENLKQEHNTLNKLLQQTKAVKYLKTEISNEVTMTTNTQIVGSSLSSESNVNLQPILLPTVVPSVFPTEVSHTSSQTEKKTPTVSVSKTMVYKAYPGNKTIYLGTTE
jgi:hypothetical protein